MDFPTVLYRVPGPHFGNYDYTPCADAEAYDGLRAAGWHDTLVDARGASKVIAAVEAIDEAIDEISPPTRAELEAKADELGVSFNSRTKDDVLAARIAEKL